MGGGFGGGPVMVWRNVGCFLRQGEGGRWSEGSWGPKENQADVR